VRRIYETEGSTLVSFQPIARRRILSRHSCAMLTTALTEVVSDQGTARRAAVPGFRVAGKTGTTRKLVDGRYSPEKHMASFSGFLPANNPRVVITVVVNEPRFGGTGYGGVVAAPSFRKVAEEVVAYLGIQPEETVQYDRSGPLGLKVTMNNRQ
ncbi:MAG: penicillin-binding transpeptidase domain-containing protein, partial [Opitutales bacterium]